MKRFFSIITIVAVATFFSCGGGQNAVNDHDDHSGHDHSAHAEEAGHDDGHGHSHNETLQLTAYSEDFEVFAETTPFVAGKPSDILAHFTFLKDFKPLTEGKVTATLTVDSESDSKTLDAPTRKGICKFELTSNKAGVGVLAFDIETANESYKIEVPVTVYGNEHKAHSEAARKALTSSNGAVFTKEQSWKVDFATAEAKCGPFGEIIRATAQILPSQGDERVIAAKAAGIVSFAGQNIVDGRAVSAGQTLFTIESSDMADNNLNVRYSEAVAEYDRSKAELERKKELAKDKIVSESELQSAQSSYTSAEAVYRNLSRNFSKGRQSAGSPIGGFVKQVLVRSGQYVEAGEALAVVSQNRDLLIRAEIQPKYYSLLGGITSANIRMMNSEVVYTLEELGGKVLSYGRSSDAGSPLIPVVFQVRNSIGLLSGSFVEMYIKTKTETQAITVPCGAITEEMGNYFVFVQLTPELFEKRPVVKGVTDGFSTQIIDGVSAGERVVSKGAILVKLAQASGALDAHSGHVH